MSQNKKLIKSVSHLHPKIKGSERKNLLRQLPRDFLQARWANVGKWVGWGVGASQSVQARVGARVQAPSLHSPCATSPVSMQLTQKNNEQKQTNKKKA